MLSFDYDLKQSICYKPNHLIYNKEEKFMSTDFKKELFERTADAFVSNANVLVEFPNYDSMLI